MDSGDVFEKGKSHCAKMTRRNFLKTTGASVALLSTPMVLTGCDDVVQLPAVEPPVGRTTVAMVQESDIVRMVREAMEMAGGLPEIKAGDKVVIKPNITTYDTFFNARVTTHPEVLKGVIQAVKEKTHASNITVADACAFNMSTRHVAELCGIYGVTREEGVTFQGWELTRYIAVTHEAFKHVKFDLKVPLSLYDNDHFINVPMLKNHDMVTGSNVDYTCCIKNHVGVLHPLNRFHGGAGIHTPDLGEVCAELNLAVPRHVMNVVDALTVVLTGGPAATNMDFVEPGFVFAGKDRVACDSVGVAALKYYGELLNVDRPYVNKSVWDQAQIKRALELKLGRTKDRIDVVEEGVTDFDAIMDKWA